MMKLKEKWNAQTGHRLFFLMDVQIWTILILICVWMVIVLIDKWIDIKTWLSIVTGIVTAVAASLIIFWGSKFYIHLRFYSKPFITFEADSKQVFHLSKKVTNLEYSVGERRWEKLRTQNIVFGGSDGNLLLRGQYNKGTDSAKISFATDALVICTGDIRTLVDYKHYNKIDTSKAVFKWLFSSCNQLVVAPELPSKDLAKGCYKGMFSGCISLRTPPELPSICLKEECYSKMFSGCTSLKRAPELPAANLDKNCYKKMFSDCTSLSNVTLLANKIDTDYFECFKDWLKNTSAKGTFQINSNVEKDKWIGSGVIPEEWDIKKIDQK